MVLSGPNRTRHIPVHTLTNRSSELTTTDRMTIAQLCPHWPSPITRSLFAILLIACSNHLVSQTLKPLRVTVPPIIDGHLDDPAWAQAPTVSDFITFAPDFGKQQQERTVVSMAYDPENLYFAFRCFDDPALVKTSISARDAIRSDDWVCINLDTFGDQQGLTALYINPQGIQTDSRFAGGNEDFSVDMVWYSAGQMTSDGYNVEVHIPLHSIRYRNADPAIMTVFFERYISRRTEHGSYPAMDPKKGFAFFSQMTPMEYHGLTTSVLLEVLPAVTFNEQSRHSNGSLNTADVRREASLTAKYGITSDLVLDATINPDFSQVEADAGQVDVNLRFNLFFAEKRPFFLEGRELFDIGAGGGYIQSLLYTRAIADPRTGLRLTGKVGDKNTLALLYANDDLGQVSGFPATAHFGVARYKRSLDDDSFIGGMAATRTFGDSDNHVGGLDAQIRVGAGAQIEGHLFASQSKPLSNSGALPMSGQAMSLQFQQLDRDGVTSLGVEHLSDHFSADMGFITRTGVTSISGAYQPYFYPESKFWNRIAVGVNAIGTRDHASALWEYDVTALTTSIFRGNLAAQFRATVSTEVFRAARFSTSGVYFQGGGQFYRWLGVTLIYRYGDNVIYGLNPLQGRGQRVQAIITLQPIEQIRVDYSLTYQDLHRTADDTLVFAYPINRLKAAYQFNKYLFFRVTLEYNGFRKRLPADALVSFTYIPGTVLHAGYGSIYNRQRWDGTTYVADDGWLEMNRGFFFKASYLWRL